MPGIMPTMTAISFGFIWNCLARLGMSGSSSLCDTVTTGKCLTGLICGSPNTVHTSR